jgi:acetyl/propionyl-CoA carboxylase alpha subunit/acetyl-CoA carboxylase carboxyltransferase component
VNEADPSVVLIANRGEVAVRVERTARSMGLTSVSVHAEDDLDSPHVRGADRSIALPGEGPAAYLDVEAVVTAAKEAGAGLVHPGYGFLSESPELARRCAEESLLFVGPSADSLALLGDKLATRELACSVDVPVLEATAVVVDDRVAADFLASLGERAGVMVKAAGGGGGRGMRVVFEPADLPAAMERARSESRRSFGRADVYLERYISRARHIEVQVIGDGRGWISLGLRDCSVQRRHQKVIEVAPPAGLSAELTERLIHHAIALCRAASATGLVTVEFLLDLDRDNMPSFIEANPRLQVEHGITEAVTGLDLVALQLGLATGRSLAELGLTGHVPARGVAMEARVIHRAAPGADRLTRFVLPGGPGVRVDTHAVEGYRLPAGYDPLLLKVIVHDEDGDAERAAKGLEIALGELVVEGVATDVERLREIASDPGLFAGRLTTGWLDALEGATLSEAAATVGSSETAALAPVSATIVALLVEPGDRVRRGQPVAVLEAMKMEHEVLSPGAGRVDTVTREVGESVEQGDVIAGLELDAHGSLDDYIAPPDAERGDLGDVLRRHDVVLDAARPDAVTRRHATGARTARENVSDLCEHGTFREYGPLVIAAQRTRRSVEELERETPADGVVAGFGTLRGVGRPTVGLLAFDYTVLAGTQGLQGHKKAERIFEIARRRRTPVVVYAEGGGGRPGDVDNLAKATGMDLATFVALGRLNGLVPTVAVVSGRCFAGNAALAGACDLLVATRNANLGMGGPAMVEGGGLGRFHADEIGPAEMQARNGVVDVLVDDEAEATDVVRRYLGYFSGRVDDWSCADQDGLRTVVPESRRRAFDVRVLLRVLCDNDSVLELRHDFGRGVVTALARVEGRPLGVVANDGAHLGGAIDSDGADKMARFLQLCDAHGLPVVTLSDTPGFLVGPEAEKQATVRHVSRLFVLGPNLDVPLCTIIVRKAYGMGGQAMAGGGFRVPDAIVAWPSGELGAMGPEGAVTLGFRRELEGIEDSEDRRERYEALFEEYVATGRAINAASVFELDDVIDPAETRSWIGQSIDAYDWTARPDRPRRIDTW